MHELLWKGVPVRRVTRLGTWPRLFRALVALMFWRVLVFFFLRLLMQVHGCYGGTTGEGWLAACLVLLKVT